MSAVETTAAPVAPSVAQREARLTAALVTGALVAGAVLQIWIPPGPLTLVAATGIASLVVLGLSLVVPGRLRSTLAGFRFTSTLLIALAIFAVIGTLVLQGKPHALYLQRYGGVFGRLIIALRFDDIFHGLPYAGLAALFGAAILASASLRWPVSLRRAGFFIAHVGLLISGAGAAASSVLSVRGRLDLQAGMDSPGLVQVTQNGLPTGRQVPLGFDLRLDNFDLVNYETEWRVGYYEKIEVRRGGQVLTDWRLKTSFDPAHVDSSAPEKDPVPDLSRHRLPGGASFRLKAVYPDFTMTPRVTPAPGGPPALQVTLGSETRWLMPGETFASPDGRVAVVLGVGRPDAPPGVLTSFLISAADRTVWLHTADGEVKQPLVENGTLGGIVRVGQLVPGAQRVAEYGTRSGRWQNPVALLEATVDGHVQEQLVSALQPRGVFVKQDESALVFEKREEEVKAFRSHVTVRQGNDLLRAVIAVNDPLTYGGWTLYQVNYSKDNPNYSGLEAVRDPGVSWVFLGFALICVGVGYMFYVEPKLRGGGIERPGTPAAPPPAQA